MCDIVNLTQHPATPDQINDGVVDLPHDERTELQRLLTFEERPSRADVVTRAKLIAFLARDYPIAMIGGAPYLMEPLAKELKTLHVNVLYSFSRRVSVEERQEDGTVKKITVFRHCGFVVG